MRRVLHTIGVGPETREHSAFQDYTNQQVNLFGKMVELFNKKKLWCLEKQGSAMLDDYMCAFAYRSCLQIYAYMNVYV